MSAINDHGSRPTWDDARELWLREQAHKPSLQKDREIFRWLDKQLGGIAIASIDRPALVRIAEAKAAVTGLATANRSLALLRAVLRRAHRVWEWIEKCPTVPTFQVSTRRIRWLTHAEAQRLLSRLSPHQAAMARFALLTGLRQRNVCRLRWADVCEERRCAWVHADQAKNRKALAVPLNSSALRLLQAQRNQHPDFVFAFRGRPVWHVNTGSWRKAVKAAGLQDFRWHDLRHTWASWHVQAGTPLNVLQELGGWSSFDMVRRYAHLSAAHLAPHAERVSIL